MKTNVISMISVRIRSVFIPRKEAQAEVVSTGACRKLVTDIIYEARLQAIVNYNAMVKGRRVSKVEARGMTLSQVQYIQVSGSF
jgi:hypothetical protein